MPTLGASAGQVSRRRGSLSATLRAMVSRRDPLTVALFVYFVALILAVVVLLILTTFNQ
jgi:type VI protein secretion system component VasF